MGGGDSIKSYLNMLASCRLACEVSNTDITEFFDRWGFSQVGELDVDRTKAAIAKMNLLKAKKIFR